MKGKLIIIVLLNSLFIARGQGDCGIRGPIANPAPGVLNGVYVQEHIPTKKVIPYEFVREADVVWSKRVWRAIDMREKFNHPLYYPLDDLREGETSDDLDIVWKKNNTRWSLWTILRCNILSGTITAYSPYDPDWQMWADGDLFKYPITPDKYGLSSSGTYYTDSVFRKFLKEGYFGETDLSGDRVAIKSIVYPDEDSIDDQGETQYYPREFNWITSEDIVQYRLKEDWFFDKERSVMDVRIIGICPVVYQKDQEGNISGFKELFWCYFPECRYVFQNYFVQSRQNDAQRMSFDDLFWKRMFTSYIIKESNIYDREIHNYRAGVEALLESEKIKEKIFVFEHDLWSY